MNTSAIIMMLLGCGGLWGGLVVFVSIANNKSKNEK